MYQDSVWLAGSGRDLTAFRTVSNDLSTWTDKPSNANGTAYIDMVQFDDVMLTFGGLLSDDEISPSVSRINQYNISSQVWSTLDVELPMTLGGASAQLIGPSVFIFGGIYYKDAMDGPYFSNKSWIIPCIKSGECDYGCDVQTGLCISPPVGGPNSTPDNSPVNGPKSATSNAVVNALFGAIVLAAWIVALA